MARRSTHGPRRTRIGSIIATIALVGALVVATASVSNAVVTCKVKNTATGQKYAGGGEALTDAIAEAASENRLKIRGTCVGNYDLNKDLRLIGEESAALGPPTLDGNDAGTVLLVFSGVTAKVVELTITNGNAGGVGGGISNNGTLTLNESTVSGNTAGFLGGGISNNGTLTINRSAVSGNATGGAGEAGGIFNSHFSTLTINRSTVSGNSAVKAGGIHVDGTVTVFKSEVSGNTATDLGGGFEINGGDLTLNLTTVTGNAAGNGGGIFNSVGSLTLISSTVTGNTPNDCVGAGCP